MHAPHHAPDAYLAEYRGKFDKGWDVERDDIFAKQLEMGLFPPGTNNTARPDAGPRPHTVTRRSLLITSTEAVLFPKPVVVIAT